MKLAAPWTVLSWVPAGRVRATMNPVLFYIFLMQLVTGNRGEAAHG